jgi:hypothetical protein
MSKLVVENIRVNSLENSQGVNLATLSADGRFIFNGSVSVPVQNLQTWTSTTRPNPPEDGLIGFNETTKAVEQYLTSNSRWVKVQKFSAPIVRDGLIMYLDAGDPNSYPGTGSFWRDLSGKCNHMFLRNIDFDTDYGGVLRCNGSSGSYGESVWFNMTNSDHTVMTATRYTGFGNNQRGRMVNARSNNWLVGQWANAVNKYYAQGWVSSSSSGGGDNTWRIYAGTGDMDSDQWQLYTNAVSVAGPNTGGSRGPNGLRFGVYQNFTEVTDGQCGFILGYNRVLSQPEIQQNYDYFKSRYGLT